MGGTDIAVSCCSDDGSAMRRFGATDNSDCRQASTFQDAFAMCDQEGYRLCTLEEMLQRTTKGTGCNHDVRYNWVSTPCGAGTGHMVAQGDRADGNCKWKSAAADSYCQSDSSNQAAYREFSGKHVLDIGIRCCWFDCAYVWVENECAIDVHSAS